MAYFGVKTQYLNGVAGTMDSEAAKMLSLYAELISVKKNLHMQSAASETIKMKLQNVAFDLDRERHSLINMADGLRQVSSMYDSYEERIVNHANGKDGIVNPSVVWRDVTESNSSPINSSQDNDESTDSEYKPNGWNLLWKSVGKAGFLGSIVGAVGKAITGDSENPKTWVSYYKDLITGGIATFGKFADDKSSWEVFLGLGNNALSRIPALSYGTIWRAALDVEVDKFIPSTAKTVGQNIGVVAKWTGVAFSGLSNYISNMDEYNNKKISKERAIKETVMETVVDTGIGIGASAIASAGLVALGVTSAPAVAVGAISVGIVWGADEATKAITKAVTGEATGLTEVISDTALNAAEAIEKGVHKARGAVVDAGAKAGEAVRDAGKAVCSWGKSIVKWAF